MKPIQSMVLAATIMALSAGPSWALFETNKELASTAKITLEEAVKHALKLVPGRAVEAEIGTDDGRTVYEIEIIDKNKKTQNVLVDAQSGQAKVEK